MTQLTWFGRATMRARYVVAVTLFTCGVLLMVLALPLIALGLWLGTEE